MDENKNEFKILDNLRRITSTKQICMAAVMMNENMGCLFPVIQTKGGRYKEKKEVKHKKNKKIKTKKWK